MHIIQMIWLEEVQKKGTAEDKNWIRDRECECVCEWKSCFGFSLLLSMLWLWLSRTRKMYPHKILIHFRLTHTIQTHSHSHSNLLFARSPTHPRKYVYVDHKSILEQNVVILFMIMVNTSTINDIPTHNEQWLRRWWEWRCMVMGKTGHTNKDSSSSSSSDITTFRFLSSIQKSQVSLHSKVLLVCAC